MSAGEVRDKFLRYAAALGAARARALADQVLEAPPDTPLKELVS
jgi:hypothetical protein